MVNTQWRCLTLFPFDVLQLSPLTLGQLQLSLVPVSHDPPAFPCLPLHHMEEPRFLTHVTSGMV